VIRNIIRQRDRARETAAQLEEENALLMWLHAEAVWKLQLESAKSWARFDRVAGNVEATVKRDVTSEIETLRRKLQGIRVWHKGDPEPKYVASVRDVHGDVWTRDHTGVWRTPETAPCGWGYMANKWAPLTEVVERDPAVVDLSLTRSQELERDAADMETHGGELE